jgi:hypothetical protein
VGLGILQALPGDTVTLERLSLISQTGIDDASGRVRQMGPSIPGAIGVVGEADLAAAGFPPDTYSALEGYEFDAGDGRIELVLRLVGSEPAATIDGVRLLFRVNGTVRSQDLQLRFAACDRTADEDWESGCADGE